MTRWTYIIGLLVILAAIAATVAVYAQLPESVATHWDLNNHPNGYSPKWALFLIGPGMMAGIVLLTCLLPWLSPKQFEVDGFRSTYEQIMLSIVLLLGYCYAVMLWVAIGHSVNIGKAIVGGVCLLFAFMGNLMGRVRRNFFVGIRTPWALADERVWNATHRLAAKVFVVGGIFGLILTLLGAVGWPALVVIVAMTLVPVVYSLVFYKQLERRGEL
jgi:uncharacterized membrane protein